MKRALVVLVAQLSGGCWVQFGSDRPYDPPPDDIAPPPAASEAPPEVSVMTNVMWPPIGHDGVSVRAKDPDANLRSLSFEFANTGTRWLSGSQADVTVSGPELGEGYGTLELIAVDARGKRGVRQVHNLVVDLSPPTITLGETVVRADGDLELWVGDAWVLGSVQLEVGGAILESKLPPGYPETLGQTWDYSLVKFAMPEVVAGESPATITAIDAAGNSSSESFSLVVDAWPPTVSIVTPSSGTTLSGKVEIEIEASDPGGGPVFVELTLGGVPAGNAAGSMASFGLDTSDFVAGPTQLVATARDRAGNASVASIDVIVQ